MKTERYFKISGIVCFACKGILENLARSLPGVEHADVNYATEILSLRVNSDFSEGSLFAELLRRGYSGEEVDLKSAFKTADISHMGTMRRNILLCFVLSLILSLCDLWDTWRPVQFLCATAIMFFAGQQFWADAWNALYSRTVNMSVLITIGTGTAYIYSTAAMFMNAESVFFTSCGSVLVLVLIGKYLEQSARISSVAGLKSLLTRCPQKVERIFPDGSTELIPVEKVLKGNILRIARNSIIAADGYILDGETYVDESSMTGESALKHKQRGDLLLCSTINHNSTVKIEAACDWSECRYARMVNAILSCVSGEKPKLQQLADKVCSVFIPIVIALSILTLFIWYAFLDPGNFQRALLSASSVLIVACPCAMGIATPLAVTVCVGALAKHGIFMKNPSKLETLAHLDDVCMDKTGTLTIGDADVVRQSGPITIESLKAIGIDVHLLSGDTPCKTKAAAESCYITSYQAEMLPSDKSEFIQSLQKQGRLTAMIGDGLNDTHSLCSADVGITVGNSADINLEIADVVITHNRIADLLKVIYISRLTSKNIKLSLFWSMLYNVIGILLSMLGILSPIYAGTAMSLSSACVVLNAWQLSKKASLITVERIKKS